MNESNVQPNCTMYFIYYKINVIAIHYSYREKNALGYNVRVATMASD